MVTTPNRQTAERPRRIGQVDGVNEGSLAAARPGADLENTPRELLLGCEGPARIHADVDGVPRSGSEDLFKEEADAGAQLTVGLDNRPGLRI
jgi:hypothetical protein